MWPDEYDPERVFSLDGLGEVPIQHEINSHSRSGWVTLTVGDFLRLNPSKIKYNTLTFLTDALASGRKFAPPFLLVEEDDDLLRIFDHEGRGRCECLRRIYWHGRLEIPVMVRFRKLHVGGVVGKKFTLVSDPDASEKAYVDVTVGVCPDYLARS